MTKQVKEKKITKTLPQVKELPVALSSLHKNDDNGFWTWASREIQDSTGDLVLVDGIDFSTYHQPAEGVHLKVLAQHMRELPDGKAPVVGIVTDHVICDSVYNGQMVKGLACYVKWLRDPNTGELLELAAHYKAMKDAQGIDQTSIGFLVDQNDMTPNKVGGLDIAKATIFEMSLVTVPANASASFIKALKDEFGDLLDLPEVKSAPEVKPEVTPEVKEEVKPEPEVKENALYNEIKGLLGSVLEMMKAPKKDDQPYDMKQLIGESIKEVFSPIQKSVNDILERLSMIESELVVLSSVGIKPTDNPQDDAALKELKNLKDALDSTLSFLQ